MDPTQDIRARVLFVDDEPAVLEGIRHAFRKYPYEILTANSGTEALRLLEVTHIHVVVSDERMPNMSGSMFLGIVCHKYPETIRIILTGQATLDAAIRAVNEGEIYRFLLKPCDATDLAQTIHGALQLWELRRQATLLLSETRQRGRALRELEQKHPGITQVTRASDGSIDLDAESTPDVETLVADIKRELSGPSAEHPGHAPDATRRAS